MTIKTRVTRALSIALLCVLATGCDGARDARTDATTAGTDADSDADGKKSFIGRHAARAIAEASSKLETENVRVDRTHVNIGRRSYYGADRSTEKLPRAEITPGGEFLVEGEPVQTTAGQRQLLLDHRQHLLGLARSGMAIGVQGADIAGTALGGIGEVMFGGEEGRRAYEARIEAEAAEIEREAHKLCQLLPPLYESQQALAAALPAFAPYATMTPDDVEDCGSDADDEAVADAADGIPA